MNQATEQSKFTGQDALVYQQLAERVDDAMSVRNDAKRILDAMLPESNDELRLAISVYVESHSKHALARDHFNRCFPREP